MSLLLFVWKLVRHFDVLLRNHVARRESQFNVFDHLALNYDFSHWTTLGDAGLGRRDDLIDSHCGLALIAQESRILLQVNLMELEATGTRDLPIAELEGFYFHFRDGTGLEIA